MGSVLFETYKATAMQLSRLPAAFVLLAIAKFGQISSLTCDSVVLFRVVAQDNMYITHRAGDGRRPWNIKHISVTDEKANFKAVQGIFASDYAYKSASYVPENAFKAAGIWGGRELDGDFHIGGEISTAKGFQTLTFKVTQPGGAKETQPFYIEFCNEQDVLLGPSIGHNPCRNWQRFESAYTTFKHGWKESTHQFPVKSPVKHGCGAVG